MKTNNFSILDKIRSLQAQVVEETRWLRRFERAGEVEAVEAHKRTLEILGRQIDNLETMLGGGS